jgi:hypothetical protein
MLLRRMLITGTGVVTERLQVREIDDGEGQRLVRIVRRGSGSVVTWRRAQMVLLSAQAWMRRRSRRWHSPARTGSGM